MGLDIWWNRSILREGEEIEKKNWGRVRPSIFIPLLAYISVFFALVDILINNAGLALGLRLPKGLPGVTGSA